MRICQKILEKKRARPRHRRGHLLKNSSRPFAVGTMRRNEAPRPFRQRQLGFEIFVDAVVDGIKGDMKRVKIKYPHSLTVTGGVRK